MTIVRKQRSRSLAERVWEKVTKTDECWLWVGSKARGGYGRIWANGRQRPATQVVWELVNNARFPPGMDACHTCDNPPCVRPDHIFVGSAAENTADALRKGRLRSHNTTKTHCPKGHAYSGQNTRIDRRGRRACKVCCVERTKAWRAKNRGVAA